ncbi:hypothetical protein [Tessaracoccus sp. OH4464_COT-324]|uniref:hypothetical protein n=1 Tax=Tessaracoccus sp. OH4464_COT-324 TaxID=2491059 RepID=UPI000F6414A3|nr:hypothetical protein [Tessaracoccus sp. OH4464_COT-324]RRD47817.1 hypothetical protein EII42_00750 [Tessaracoccus sp. OH4464_COT-324]
MVGKLLKFEFQRTRSMLAMLWLATAGLLLLSYALCFVNSALAGVVFVPAGLLWLLLPVVVQLYLAFEAYRSSFGRRGYFMHVLPVRGGTLVLTKLGYMVLISAISLALSVVLLPLTTHVGHELKIVPEIGLGDVWKLVSESGGPAYFFLAFVVLSIVVFTPLQYLFCVCVGAESWISRTGGLGPFLTYLLLYVAQQVVMTLALLLPVSLDMITGEIVFGSSIGMAWGGYFGPYFPLGIVIAVVAICVALLWRTLLSVTRKLELR